MEITTEIAGKANLDKPRIPNELKSFAADSKVNDLFTEDPATFLIAYKLIVNRPDTLTELKEYFSSTPELLSVVDQVVADLEEQGVVSVDGDCIKVKAKAFYLEPVTRMNRVLPQITKKTLARLFDDYNTKDARELKDLRQLYRLFVLPDDEETLLKAQAICLEASMKLESLFSDMLARNPDSKNVRIISILNANVYPKDVL